MVERDDGFRRLDEPTALGSRVRERRAVERLDARREELAPRGVGAILDAGFDALRARFLPCFGLCAALWLAPAWLIAYAPVEPPTGTDPMELLGQIAASLSQSALSAVVQLVATLVVSVIVRGEFVGERVTLGEAVALLARRALPLIGCLALVVLLSFAGLILCVLPYFLVLWRTSFAPLVCATDGRGPVESVRHAFDLTRGTFQRWLGIAIVTAAIFYPLTSAAGAASQGTVRGAALENLALPVPVYDALLWMAATLFFAIATAGAAAITTAFYYDSRVRREGLDLRMRLDEIAGERAVGAAA